MAPKSDAPGLKWRTRRDGTRVPYWVSTQVVRDTQGFPDKTIRLPADANDEQLAAHCRDHTARLAAWLDAPKDEPRLRTKYNGTYLSLSRIFQEHPDSSFHDCKANTRKFYTDSLKVIEATVGLRVVQRTTVLDAKRWFRNWGAPTEADGPRRPKRAHDAISMLRQILRFGHALGHDECGVLVERLANIRFQRPEARDEEMTFAQAAAFVRTALDRGERDMAIGVAAQFELMLRQKDIIGEWGPLQPDAGEGAVHIGGETWAGPFRWENIPGWKLRIRTSKTRAKATFDLTAYPLLFPLLEAVPHAERTGAIVKGEHELPIRERSYRKWYREIARAAGIPDSVWSMDSRAGGATEASEAGADLKAIAAHLTHANLQTTPRYIRKTDALAAQVAQMRAKSRQNPE